MLGEREAVVLDARPVDIHGVAYVDIAVGFRDGSTATARIGRESAPGDLRAGEAVLVSTAVNMIVAVRRPGGDEPRAD
jgi:hypothetical protein